MTSNLQTARDRRPTRLPFRPKQTLGQNFLRDANIARKIARSLTPPPGSPILEIGPGLGALTIPLLETWPDHQVIAVDIDQRCIEFLRDRCEGIDNLTILHQDFLELDARSLGDTPITVVGNLPYHITSPVLMQLFEHRDVYHEATIMIQREVADRIVAPPGNRSRGILSVYAQYYSRVSRLFTVAPPAFIPPPDVASAVLSVTLQHGNLSPVDDDWFRQVVRTAFQQRRKQLTNSLKALTGNRDIDGLQRRPEALTVDEFLTLATQLSVAE
jgi:16S rRNA (adenine1518-N6/adenine1519-N6)-dimethyltransferase